MQATSKGEMVRLSFLVVGDSTKESGMQILNNVFGCSRMLVLVGKRYFSFGSCNVSEDDAISGIFVTNTKNGFL